MVLQTIAVLLEVAISTLLLNVLLGNASCRVDFAHGKRGPCISETEEVMTSSCHL